MTFAIPVLKKILPIPKKLEKAARDAKTIEEFKMLAPGRNGGEIYIDGTYVPLLRPGEDQASYYSGKRHRHAYAFTVTSNRDNLILSLSGATEGRTHDFTMLKNDPPSFGMWYSRMLDPNTPYDERIIVRSDLGYQGIEAQYPGIISKQPAKKPRNGRLTKTQKEENKRINSKRAKVEHTICLLKHYKRLTKPYDDTKERFNDEAQVIAGLINQRIMMRNKQYYEFLD